MFVYFLRSRYIVYAEVKLNAFISIKYKKKKSFSTPNVIHVRWLNIFSIVCSIFFPLQTAREWSKKKPLKSFSQLKQYVRVFFLCSTHLSYNMRSSCLEYGEKRMKKTIKVFKITVYSPKKKKKLYALKKIHLSKRGDC